jgi:hypothetical protein
MKKRFGWCRVPASRIFVALGLVDLPPCHYPLLPRPRNGFPTLNAFDIRDVLGSKIIHFTHSIVAPSMLEFFGIDSYSFIYV